MIIFSYGSEWPLCCNPSYVIRQLLETSLSFFISLKHFSGYFLDPNSHFCYLNFILDINTVAQSIAISLSQKSN